jgi:hypothetical protein
MAQRIKNYEFIEVTIPQASTATRFNFPDQPQLRFVSLFGLEVYTPGVVTQSILSKNALLTLANLQTTFLVLYYNDKEALNQIPVLTLNRIASNSGTANPYVFQQNIFEGQQITWSKSYIETSVPYSGISSAAFSVCFGVYYA